MRIDVGSEEADAVWLDLTPGEAAQLRDALNAWDGASHLEAEWHLNVIDQDRVLTLTVGNDARNR